MWQGNLYSPVNNSDFKARDVQAWGRIFRAGAGRDVKFPPMPGTGHMFTFYMAFSEWTSGMWASVIESVDCPFDVKEGNAIFFLLNAGTSARGKVCDLGNGDEILGHGGCIGENLLS